MSYGEWLTAVTSKQEWIAGFLAESMQARTLPEQKALADAHQGWMYRYHASSAHVWLNDLCKVLEADGILMPYTRAPKGDAAIQADIQKAYGAQGFMREPHAKKRAHDKRKVTLAKDARLAQLQKIAGIELMPTQQLRDLENTLFALKTCFQLGRPDLASDPLCPHCGFRPAEERAEGPTAKQTLADVDVALDGLVQGWTETLCTNLEDPTVAGNIELLSDAIGKHALQTFLNTRQLPSPVSPAFVLALQEVLSGLQKVVLESAKLEGALSDGGLPCTVSDLHERFERYVTTLTKGRDVSKVRIVLERS